jgi:cellulose biosynthesis protein BcsQ
VAGGGGSGSGGVIANDATYDLVVIDTPPQLLDSIADIVHVGA